MNDDVLDHIIKLCRNQMRMCRHGNLIHVGGKESAISTYEKVIDMLTEMRETANK